MKGKLTHDDAEFDGKGKKPAKPKPTAGKGDDDHVGLTKPYSEKQIFDFDIEFVAFMTKEIDRVKQKMESNVKGILAQSRKAEKLVKPAGGSKQSKDTLAGFKATFAVELLKCTKLTSVRKPDKEKAKATIQTNPQTPVKPKALPPAAAAPKKPKKNTRDVKSTKKAVKPAESAPAPANGAPKPGSQPKPSSGQCQRRKSKSPTKVPNVQPQKQPQPKKSPALVTTKRPENPKTPSTLPKKQPERLPPTSPPPSSTKLKNCKNGKC